MAERYAGDRTDRTRPVLYIGRRVWWYLPRFLGESVPTVGSKGGEMLD